MRNRPVYHIILRLTDRRAARSGPMSLRRYTGVLRRYIAETGHSRGSRENRGGEAVDFSIPCKAVEEPRRPGIVETSEVPDGKEPEVAAATAAGDSKVLDVKAPAGDEETQLMPENTGINGLIYAGPLRSPGT